VGQKRYQLVLTWREAGTNDMGASPIDGCSFDTLARATEFAREMFAIRIDHDMVEATLRVFDCQERTFLCWRRALQIPRHN